MAQNSSKLGSSLLVLLLGGFLGWQAHLTYGGETVQNGDYAANSSEIQASGDLDLKLFWDVWSTIKDKYIHIDTIENQNQVYGAISGIVEALGDPYSVFMTPVESQQFQSSLDGELEGIGAELTVEEGKLVVVSPLKNSPAEEAGILPGDYIYLVNGFPTGEMTLWEAIMNIRGEPGTDVGLTVLRVGIEEPIEMTITRQKIEVPSVKLSFEERNGQTLAHLAIYQFGDDTYIEFEQAVREIVLKNADAMVLDLRLNGGGYLDVSVEILSEFFSDSRTGVIVKQRNTEDKLIKTLGEGQLTKLPLAVLIDEGSASAAEILAGALQDYQRATIIGEQSFGKGSVQELMELNDGSNLRLTIATWYTPNEHSIDHTGITPDLLVPMEPSAIDTENDVQRDAAYEQLLNL